MEGQTVSKNIEEYMEALYAITRDSGAASTIEISHRLGVAPPSVTEMLKKLDEKGYIKYSPYQGAVLTETGLRLGEKMTRKHRLLERFLYDVLKLGKEKLHAQACEMEHTLNDETERALCKILKHPTRCPDDQEPIPPCDLQFASCDECQKWGGESIEEVGKRQANLVAISVLNEHEAGQVAFLRGDDRFLRRLSDLGLTPGARVAVTRIASLRAPVEITIRGSRMTLGEDIASNVFVEKTVGEEEAKQSQETLSTMNKRLEERNRQNSIMSEMRELLQSCSTIQEMPPIVTASITRLFPDADGALFLMNSPRTDLQSVARWGDSHEEADESFFEPDACWGLRRGRIHEVEDVKIGPICPHLKHPPFAPYMCLPLIAKGDILGLLHLRTKPSTSGQDRRNAIADLKETVVIFAEYLSLSIANVRLWERLTDQSIRDPLTGLFNRRHMEETIQREILRAARNQTKIGIIMADIDHFKKFNDTHGHKAGDELLAKLADFFKFEIRGSDIACRYGGEEFILILPGSSAEGTYKRAEYLREEVKNMKVHFHDQLLPPITLSIGIATYPDHGTELNELIQAADMALYEAKEQGRDRVYGG
jgi:diguanylate cyclase (GGDEF)-like protein